MGESGQKEKECESVRSESQWKKEECTVVVANEGHVGCLVSGNVIVKV